MLPAKSLVWLLVALVAAVAAEAAIFRAGWYAKYIEPVSSAGSVEYPLYWLTHFRPANAKEILVVGDSRMAEGFSAPHASLESRRHNWTFWNFGIPGSTPRIWYYSLRDADPTRHRFEAICFALDYYNDEDQYDDQADHVWDLNFLAARLRFSDIWDFSSSMTSAENRRLAFIGAAFKGTVFQRDAQEFLADIPTRIARSKDSRARGLWFVDNYGGHSEDLTGLTVDWATRTPHFPPGLNDERQHSITEALLPRLPPNTGRTTRFRMLWLGRLIALYRNSPTKLVFFETSRGPLPQPERKGPLAFMNWAKNQPNVVFLDQTAFREFESPDLYYDGLHYNSKGREVFSKRLTRQLFGVLPR
jgi:hypothetical protein